jgi:hypothetical protein
MGNHRNSLPARVLGIPAIGGALMLLAGVAPLPAAAAAADTPVTIMGAGDIAGTAANAGATGDLIRAASPAAVFTAGDNAYDSGSASDYATKYDPTWGSFKSRTHPAPGNHEYLTSGAAGYISYFGAATVTNNVDGGLYYGWNVGNGWRAYSLNTEISTTGAQLTWLRNDVAAHPGMRYLLYSHHPRYSSSAVHPPETTICPLWDALAATGRLEIVIAGHNHQYERFAPMDCAGHETADGAVSFVVGTGGKTLYDFGVTRPGSRFRNATDFGVLKLVLHDTSFDWQFLASGRGRVGATGNAGRALDSGSQPTGGTSTPSNVAPSVNAGPDRTVTLPASASLDGTVTDDGRPAPPAAVTSTWSKVSGPGTVTFAAPSAVDTTASFSAAGTYVLRLLADDSAATAADTVTVTVLATGVGTALTTEVRVAAGSDDAEQRVGGNTTLNSPDLELVTDGTKQQVVGIRFGGLRVPARATVTAAWVQFRVDEVSSGSTSQTVRLESSARPATYATGKGTITARPVTGAVTWTPSGWPTVGAAQRTPDLAGLIQTAVNRSGWAPGNALALQFSGTGRRTAESYEGSRTAAPLLHVEYRTS